jgi:hypothetical protein
VLSPLLPIPLIPQFVLDKTSLRALRISQRALVPLIHIYINLHPEEFIVIRFNEEQPSKQRPPADADVKYWNSSKNLILVLFAN